MSEREYLARSSRVKSGGNTDLPNSGNAVSLQLTLGNGGTYRGRQAGMGNYTGRGHDVPSKGIGLCMNCSRCLRLFLASFFGLIVIAGAAVPATSFQVRTAQARSRGYRSRVSANFSGYPMRLLRSAISVGGRLSRRRPGKG